jgi:hypothetical protein
MTRTSTKPNAVALIEIHSWDEVPKFDSEREEADFWGSHSFGEEMLVEDQIGDPLLPAPRQRTSPVSLRFDIDTVKRLKALAARRNKGYQTLVKEFVAERLYEEEKREGIIGDSRAS